MFSCVLWLYKIGFSTRTCMRTEWTAKGNRDAGSSCSCDRGLHRHLRNFGGVGGVWTPYPPLSVRYWGLVLTRNGAIFGLCHYCIQWNMYGPFDHMRPPDMLHCHFATAVSLHASLLNLDRMKHVAPVKNRPTLRISLRYRMTDPFAICCELPVLQMLPPMK